MEIDLEKSTSTDSSIYFSSDIRFLYFQEASIHLTHLLLSIPIPMRACTSKSSETVTDFHLLPIVLQLPHIRSMEFSRLLVTSTSFRIYFHELPYRPRPSPSISKSASTDIHELPCRLRPTSTIHFHLLYVRKYFLYRFPSRLPSYSTSFHIYFQ